MSYHTLQRVVVRMLFDDAFVAALYSNPEETLANLDLSTSERAQLLAVDRRAWGYDSLRRRRTLRTLVEEFKISTTRVLAETRSLASLDSFFSSEHFHRSVQERGSISLNGNFALASASSMARTRSGRSGCPCAPRCRT